MQRANSSEKTLMLGKTEGRRRRGDRGWLDGIIDLNGHEFQQAPGDSEGQGSLGCYSPWGLRVRHNLATKQERGTCGLQVPLTLLPSQALGPCAVLDMQKVTCAQTIRGLIIYRENIEPPGNCTICKTLTLGEAE